MSLGGGGNVQASPGEVAQAQLAKEQWADYQDRFVPLEKEFFSRVKDVKKTRNKAKGMAGADTAIAYDAATDAVKSKAFASGENPNSGKFMGTLSDIGDARSAAASKGVINADIGTDDRYIAGLDQIVGMGRGVARDANIGYSDTASLGAADARSAAMADAVRTGAVYDAAGIVAGAGIRYGLEDSGTGNISQLVKGTTMGGGGWDDLSTKPRRIS